MGHTFEPDARTYTTGEVIATLAITGQTRISAHAR